MMNNLNAANPSRRPSDAEWAAHLPRICELYYGLRYTLEDTQRIIHHETGFNATLRMYKDRIRNMAVHPKKICMQKYQAMNIVAEDFQRQGICVHFIGPSGFQFFKRTPAQITKQLRRPHTLRPITLAQANEVLQQSSIQAIIEDTPIVTPSGDGPEFPPGNATMESTPPQRLPDTMSNFHHQPTSPFTPRHGDNFFPAPTALHQIPHPPMWNHPADAPKFNDVAGILNQPPHNRASSASMLPQGLRPDSLSLAGVVLLPERLQKPKSNDDNGQQSYDFVADFDALSIPSRETATQNGLASSNTERMLPPPSSVQRRQLAIEFAAPFFLACFPTAHSREEFRFSKSRAMDRFKYILTVNPENQFVLPLLNWMSTILSSNDKTDLLKDFTSECCQVLDTCRDAGFPLSTPFRYTLAFCNDDVASQEYHGSQFAYGTQRLIQLYGPDHPNVLVNEYFHAWHLMMQPSGWAAARSILEDCLIKSEKVMGTRDLMTINCLAVLGRGFAENGHHRQAQAIFQDVLDRFKDPARFLEAYHLLILGRLAAQEEALGRGAAVATRMFQQVYEGRMRILSANSDDTRAALNAYVQALQRHGHAEEATRVQRGFETELESYWRRDGQAATVASSSHGSPMSFSSSASHDSPPHLPSISSSRL